MKDVGVCVMLRLVKLSMCVCVCGGAQGACLTAEGCLWCSVAVPSDGTVRHGSLAHENRGTVLQVYGAYLYFN